MFLGLLQHYTNRCWLKELKTPRKKDLKTFSHIVVCTSYLKQTRVQKLSSWTLLTEQIIKNTIQLKTTAGLHSKNIQLYQTMQACYPSRNVRISEVHGSNLKIKYKFWNSNDTCCAEKSEIKIASCYLWF